MNKLLIANWKLNPTIEKEAVRLAGRIDFENVVIAPPFPFLKSVGAILKNAVLGAQDVFWKERGAYTGEVSGGQLKSLGVNYVIIGHSERRALGETDEMINKKVRAALRADLKVILCVGENLSVRKRGVAAAKNFVKNQLRKDLKFPTSYNLKANSLIIAYEPVWAIGTGKNDTPKDAAEMIKSIKNFLKATTYNLKASKVLYGGSVASKNIGGFLKYEEIDGFLVGSASLKIPEFQKIIQVVSLSHVL